MSEYGPGSVQIWRTRVSMSRDQYDLMLYRLGLGKKVAEQLRERVEELDSLLLTALQQLALAKEEEPLRFTRRWIHEHRDPMLIPVWEGGEARGES